VEARGIEQLSKAEWRARLAAARALVPAPELAAEAAALAATVVRLASDWGGTVCCYVPFGTEPGSPDLPDALRSAGVRVLLPVVPPVPGPLDWAAYDGASTLVGGRLRAVREPAGPRLGPAGIREAGVVLVPALAVDHAGTRLGRGGGYYDRSLGSAAPDARLLAVVRDSELVRRLPGESHDVRMTGTLTPGWGMIPLPFRGPRVM
jgi:5-formyltetrahydrofolate cyclo-ligase